MDIVVYKCAKCGAILESLVNAWIQIGKKYLTPVAHAEDTGPSTITTSGPVRLGEADTLVGGCRLQDAQCAECRVTLGQKCLKGPVNHVLNDGQVIFRLTSITFMASNRRSKAGPKIKRVLTLKIETPSTNLQDNPPSQEKKDVDGDDAVPCGDPAVDAFDLNRIQADLVEQRESIKRISSAGMQVVSNFETVISRVEGQMQRLSESIDSVRTEGERQSDALEALKSEVADAGRDRPSETVVARLGQQLQTVDDSVAELGQAARESKSETAALRERLTTTERELQEAKDETATLRVEVNEIKQVAHESTAVSREYACEVSSLRREVKQLRAELAEERAQSRSSKESAPYSSHELDILASSISKIGNRASQIESLQMEFELFKTRLQRLEARTNVSGASSSRGSAMMSVEADARHDEAQSGYEYEGHTRRKRASTGRDDTQSFDTTPPKRTALSPSDHDSGVSTSCSRASDLYRSSSKANSSAPRPDFRRARARADEHGTTRRESWADGG
ncbi:hypothetical protein CDD83_2726 [Cordyceps sp. RAO-2017]|nr:hypothetical protein CDD83_2726 [Cordyceps sp. RAO-2017]